MDNVTHSLTGLYLARAGLNRWAPDAVWIAMIGANAPDCDIVSALGGMPLYLDWHRNLTHALPFSPILALLTVAAVRVFTRVKTGWWKAWVVAWIAVLSHIALDLTNDYGVRVFEPFSSVWYYFSITNVFDVWIWSALLLALLAPVIGGLVSSEIGERKHRFPARGWAIAGLLFVAVYDCGRAFIHARAVNTLDSRLYDGADSVRVAAFPKTLSPLDWDALAETAARAHVYELNLRDNFDPLLGQSFPRSGAPQEALAGLRKLTRFGALIRFSQYPLWRLTPETDGTLVRLTDLRFGDPVTNTFTCAAVVREGAPPRDENCDFTFHAGFRPDNPEER